MKPTEEEIDLHIKQMKKLREERDRIILKLQSDWEKTKVYIKGESVYQTRIEHHPSPEDREEQNRLSALLAKNIFLGSKLQADMQKKLEKAHRYHPECECAKCKKRRSQGGSGEQEI